MLEKSNLSSVQDFMDQKSLAVVGVSRSKRKFGNLAYRELKARGYRVFPINKHMEQMEGDPCYPGLNALPETVDGVVVVVPPSQTETIVQEAEKSGIRRIWMQQGSESESAIQFCREHGMTEIHGECILMYAQPLHSIHRLHRGIRRLFGSLPK